MPYRKYREMRISIAFRNFKQLSVRVPGFFREFFDIPSSQVISGIPHTSNLISGFCV